ncbi:MAG: DNA repair protein RecN [Gammaproteobacteria bacterium]|nr:DNA repair protein RecN [Gammaproteobacteria bacterium]
MLISLQIRNYAIVDEIHLDFERGMTVVSGETGAGKSILLHALGLTLGDRAESGVVSPGAKRAEIVTTFDLSHRPELLQWLQELELDADEECLIRRTISAEGRSQGYINHNPVPLQKLKMLGERLVELHGQHAHQSLLSREEQRKLLDHYAGLDDDVHHLASLYQQWQDHNREKRELITRSREREDRRELLSFQIQELEELNLLPGELEEIEQQHQKLTNLSTLIDGVAEIQQQLEGDGLEQGALLQRLDAAQRQLQQLAAIDRELDEASLMAESAAIHLGELSSLLRHYLDRAEGDPQRLEQLEDRLSLIHDLARKHHIQPTELQQRHEEIRQELETLVGSDSRLVELEQAIATLRCAYERAAAKISKRRRSAARQLEKRVSDNIQALGMGDGAVKIECKPLESGGDPPSPHGLEQITYTVRTNPGHPFKPLSKIASGGELSRISLAIQVLVADKSAISTMIFDEVDVGVGGKTAEMVGFQLHALGERTQVICITHQPQVAAQGDHHLHIRKESGKSGVKSVVSPLDDASRIEEIARMSGGSTITEQTRSHALEMVAQSRRKQLTNQVGETK